MDGRKPEEPKTVTLYEHENALWHYNMTNKRMLLALITVCVTFIITNLVFVHGYTVREKNWLDTLSDLNKSPGITEVTADGLPKQPVP